MAQAEVGAQIEERARRQRGFRYYMRRFSRDRRALVGAFIMFGFVFSAFFGADLGPIPGFAPYDAQAQAFELLEPPTIGHPLGTDNIGRDLLSRLIVGSRTSLIVGVLGLTFAALVGLPLGVLGGYYGGWIDMLTQRYIDVQWAFPNFIIAVMLVGIFGLGVINVIAAIFLAYIDDFARVIRAMVLAIKEEDYILAARAGGVSDWRIMYKHVFPNALPPVIVVASVFFSSAILIEAGSVTLLNGQEVPLIVPEIRSMFSWSTPALIEAVLGPKPANGQDDSCYDEQAEEVSNFLDRVYYEISNLGVAPQER